MHTTCAQRYALQCIHAYNACVFMQRMLCIHIGVLQFWHAGNLISFLGSSINIFMYLKSGILCVYISSIYNNISQACTTMAYNMHLQICDSQHAHGDSLAKENQSESVKDHKNGLITHFPSEMRNTKHSALPR